MKILGCSPYQKNGYSGILGLGLTITIAVAEAGLGFAAPPVEPADPLAPNAVAGLGVDLLRQGSPETGNYFFSPYSIAACLALVASGARGETQAELLRALHGGPDAERLSAALGAVRSKLEAASGEATLALADGLWIQQDAALQEAFLTGARTRYHAEIRPVDFRNAADEVRGEINAWVAEKTGDKIQNIVAPGAVDATTRLVLADAIYFKGKWAEPFEKNETAARPFFTADGKWTQPSTMLLLKQFRFLKGANFKAVELPYEGNALSMVVVLPDEIDQIAKFSRNFTSEKLAIALASLDFARKETVSLWLPKFKVETTLDLGEALSSLGVRRAFDGQAADFSGIGKKLYISTATHKAYVAVDELGTEAAAATVVGLMTFGVKAPPKKITEFKADHPFLFLIRENTSGTILFLGRISDPHFSDNWKTI